MDRVPEPELMDTAAQARAYVDADFAEPHQMFVRLYLERFGATLDGRVLDLGCGPGDVTARYARAVSGCEIDGFDGSKAMLSESATTLARHGGDLASRIRFCHGLLPGDAPPRPPYDGVISNSLLHHLHDPGVLWRAVARYARPGAPIFVMDLVRPPSLEEADRLTALHAAGAPEVLREDFRNSLRAAFTKEEIVRQLDEAGLAGFELALPTDRHVIIWGRR